MAEVRGYGGPARRTARFTAEDIVVVAGWREPDEVLPASVVQLVRRAAASGARVVSLCTGAFVLAAAGILDGHRATTHWRYAAQLARRYPLVDVDATALFTQTGRVFTSAGTVAGVDLCLHLIRQEHGAQIANDVARHLVIGTFREGGQAQYIETPVPRNDDSHAIGASMAMILRRLDEPLTVQRLATQAHLSTRQYLRRFRAATGTTPYQWMLSRRIHRARELLERTTAPIEQIAVQCGFRNATTLRDHFGRSVGITPSRYRTQFRSTETEPAAAPAGWR